MFSGSGSQTTTERKITMNELIFKLEEIKAETIVISELFGTISEALPPKTPFSEAINFVYTMAVENGRKLDECWAEMVSEMHKGE